MRRWKYHLAAAVALLLIGWGLHKMGWMCGNSEESTRNTPLQIKSANPMETPSGWRYRQSQPHHWRYIMLQR